MIEISYSREKGVLKNTPQEVQEVIAEYVGMIVCSNGEGYTNSLII